MLSRNRSLARNIVPMMPFRAASSSGVFSQREQSTGTTVTATNSDIASENITTNDSWPNRMLDGAREEEQRDEDGDVRERRRQNRGPDLLARRR